MMVRLSTLSVVVTLAMLGFLGGTTLWAQSGLFSEPKGEANHRWIAPYVQFDDTRIHESRRKTVKWFNTDGSISRELEGFRVERTILVRHSLERDIYHSMMDDWEIAVAARQHTMWTSDGSVFLVPEGDKRRKYIELYLDGELQKTLGPYSLSGPAKVNLSDTGVISIPYCDNAPDRIRVDVLDKFGERLFAVRSAPLRHITSATADGILFGPELKNQESGFLYRASDGDTTTILSRLGFCMWAPQPHQGYFVSRDILPKFSKVDCLAGRKVWEFEHQISPLSVAVLEDLLIVYCVLFRTEIYPKHHTTKSEEILAINNSTGALVAEWHNGPLRNRKKMDWGHTEKLMWHDEGLYFVTKDKFTKVEVNEIRKKWGGWVLWDRSPYSP